MGGSTAYIRVMYEGYGIRGRGEVLRAVDMKGGLRTTAESHVKRDFGRRVGAAATGIWQAWSGRARRGGVSL